MLQIQWMAQSVLGPEKVDDFREECSITSEVHCHSGTDPEEETTHSE